MLELLTAQDMQAAEQLAVAGGVAEADMMESAGRGVAEEVMRGFPRGARVAVLCGPGRNGGDGFVAARHLRERGYKVRASLIGKVEALPGLPRSMVAAWDEPVGELGPDSLVGADLVVDALWGAGLSRTVNGVAGELIEKVNSDGLPVVAVDMPTGVDMTHGTVDGPAFRATATVTFFRRKTGQMLLPGRRLCGRVRVADIGIGEDVIGRLNAQAFRNDPEFWLRWLPRLTADGHKYDRGHAVVVSGPMESTGAARLAARAALRMGAGLVSVATSKTAFYVNAAQLTTIMLAVHDGPESLAAILEDERKNAVLIGPGAGTGGETRDLTLAVLASGASAVLDADALTAFADDPETLFGAIAGRAAPVILTPHEGEFARLFSSLGNLPSKLDRARRAAEMAGAVIVLKGPDTIVAAPDGLATIADNAPPWLATAGSGDVLAGLITSLVAQGMAAFDAAAAGVHMHGELGRACGPGLTADDLDGAIKGLLLRLNAIEPLF